MLQRRSVRRGRDGERRGEETRGKAGVGEKEQVVEEKVLLVGVQLIIVKGGSGEKKGTANNDTCLSREQETRKKLFKGSGEGIALS
eukprot:3120285-Rhodomonas_salina.2